MSYIINESLSKEDNLEHAKLYADKAQELLNQFDNLLAQINKDFPVSTVGLSRTKEAKLKSPSEVYDRLKTAALAYKGVKNMYEVREWKELQKQKQKKVEEEIRQTQQNEKEMLNEAIAFCIDSGKIFGKDFTVDTAIGKANDIAFWKEVDRRETEIRDEFIEFNGQNCDSDCNGWNPQYHRCQCGNRRVKWEMVYEANFNNMKIYAEAY